MFAGKKQRAGADDDYEKQRLDLFCADLDRDFGWRVIVESPGYEGHSLANLRRVATALNARVRLSFEPEVKPIVVTHTQELRATRSEVPLESKE